MTNSSKKASLRRKLEAGWRFLGFGVAGLSKVL